MSELRRALHLDSVVRMEDTITQTIVVNYCNGESAGHPGMLAVGYLEEDGDLDTGRPLWSVKLRNIPEEDWADDEWVPADDLPASALEQLLDMGVRI